MLYAKEIVLRVPTDHYNEFTKVCEYLHNNRRQNCYYDKSAPFSYIIKLFNEEYNDYPKAYWLNEVENYNSKAKKDYRICFSLKDYQYDQFIKNCNKLKLKKSTVIRILMLKLIEETQIE